MNDRHPTPPARWLPAAAAAGLVAAVIAAGVISGGGGDEAAGTTVPVPVPTATIDPATTLDYTDQVVTESTDVAIQKVPLGRTLSDGLAGDDVAMVQQRLHDLAFDPGPVDGIYGTMTKQAIWAFEKLVMGVPRQQATGRVTPEMWDRMQDPLVIAPRRPTGGLADHTEIYLPEQVLINFKADVAVLITHVSTGELDANGEPAEYRETVTYDTGPNGEVLEEPVTKAVIGWSKTPAGVFEAYRFVPGTRNGPLGSMWNPIYINYGIAIHGALNVPIQPASHGCIRVPMHISEYLQDLIPKGQKVLIWDGKKEPEQQTKEDMLPIWDRPDPDATTTTTTSTTTTTTTIAPATTVAPTTTKPPPTTTRPPTTTTVAPTTLPPTTTTAPPG